MIGLFNAKTYPSFLAVFRVTQIYIFSKIPEKEYYGQTQVK